MRENRWVLLDLQGKGRRVRTVAVPLWVKQGINAWMTASGIEEGKLFRSVRKGGKTIGEVLLVRLKVAEGLLCTQLRQSVFRNEARDS